MQLNQLESFFKPEFRKSGDDLVNKGVVFVSNGSDTSIQTFIRASSGFKVMLQADSISSPSFTASCTCPIGARQQLCKHVWAAVAVAREKYPDFFEAKVSVNATAGCTSAGTDKPTAARPSPSAAAEERAKAFKEKQSEYRKLQYQLQKERAKKTKLEKKHAPATPSYPAEVKSALKFFAENGFSFESELSEEQVSLARKKLSRIFHPDKGGTHDEALALNENSSILENYLNFKN